MCCHQSTLKYTKMSFVGSFPQLNIDANNAGTVLPLPGLLPARVARSVERDAV